MLGGLQKWEATSYLEVLSVKHGKAELLWSSRREVGGDLGPLDAIGTLTLPGPESFQGTENAQKQKFSFWNSSTDL